VHNDLPMALEQKCSIEEYRQEITAGGFNLQEHDDIKGPRTINNSPVEDCC